MITLAQFIRIESLLEGASIRLAPNQSPDAPRMQAPSPSLSSPAPDHTVPRHILPTIALAQLGGTSLWFAANAIDADLRRDWALAGSTAGAVTSAVHAGFIAGTLFYSLLMIADRFSPRKVYLVSSVLAARSNAAVLLLPAARLSASWWARWFSGPPCPTRCAGWGPHGRGRRSSWRCPRLRSGAGC